MFDLATKRCWRTPGDWQPDDNSTKRPPAAARRQSRAHRLFRATAGLLRRRTTDDWETVARKNTLGVHGMGSRCGWPFERNSVCIVSLMSGHNPEPYSRVGLGRWCNSVVRSCQPTRRTSMQLSLAVVTSPESGAGVVSPGAKGNWSLPPALPQEIAGLQAAWLEPQVNPLPWRGVPESALHD